MNKRIQELARQAYIEDAKSEDPNYQPADVTDDLLEDLSGVFEKFAQLIVQECMQLNRDILCEDDPNYLDQIYREHFGVKS